MLSLFLDINVGCIGLLSLVVMKKILFKISC